MFRKFINLTIILILVCLITQVGFSKTIEIKFQTLMPGSLPREAAEKFFELLDEKTEHEIKVKYYLQGEIAGAAEVIEAIKVGMLDMANTSPSYATSWSKSLGLFELPFLWKNGEHFQNYVIEEGGGEKLGKILIEKTGIRPLIWYSTGFRWMYFKDKINSLEHLKKIKMRTPGSKVFLDLMKIIGINAITVPWSEVFTALHTGLVDAVECPPALAYPQRFHEVVKYAWPSNHMMGLQFITINEELWQSFPDDLKEAMREAAYETSYYMYGLTPMLTRMAVRSMKEETGLQVIYDVDPSPLADLFVDYQTSYAKDSGTLDILKEILEMK